MTITISWQRKSGTQNGYVMLGLIVILGIAALTVFVSRLNATAIHNDQARKTTSALAVAKQALIGSAAASNTRPGALPCPDTDNDGQSNLTAGACAAPLGRLPWRTLGLPDLRDAAGERLWYVLSPNFQDIPANAINSMVGGQLSVSGTISASNVVAVVFAPGNAIGTQTREAANTNNAGAYLESYVAGVITARAQDNSYNDELSVITPGDVFPVVEKRIAQEVQVALVNYYNLSANQYPYPALASACDSSSCVADTTAPTQYGALMGRIPAQPVPGNASSTYPAGAALLGIGTWFDLNGWRYVFNYRVDPNCVTAPAACGTLTSSFTNTSPYYGDSSYNVAGVKGILQFTVPNTVSPGDGVRMFYARGLN